MTAADARFVAAYERYYSLVYAYCRRRVGADAVDDMVAETFLVAWRKIESQPLDADVLPWLYAIAHRVVGHQWRGLSRKKRLADKLNNIGVTPVAPPEELVVTRLDSQLALKALSHLKPSDREILLLSVWEGLGPSEVASVLGIAEGTARQRIYQARKRITREFNRLEQRSNRVAVAGEEGVT